MRPPVRWLLSVLALAVSAPLAHAGLERTVLRGPVRATVRLEPDAPRIGDTLELTIEVTAEPGVELLMPAFGEALERYAISEFVPRESIDDEGRTHESQRYRLVTTRSGPQSIPPILIEFVDRRPGQAAAPEGEDAYELLTERIDFEVASVLPAGAVPDLRPALGRLGKRGTPAGPIWPWLIAGLLLLALAAPLLIRNWGRWRGRVRRRSAHEVAQGRLERLLARPRAETPEEIDAFFVELSDIVRHYLEDRFELRSPELTTEEFLVQMTASVDLLAAHQRLLRSLLRRADLVKFARHLPSPEDIRESMRAAERFLAETREDTPLIKEPRPPVRSEEASLG